MRKKKIPEKIPARTDIPDPTRMFSLSVYDGQTYLGCVIESWDVHYAFGPDNALVGEFTTERDAIHALPRAIPDANRGAR
jgi:hypothetical protein